MSVTFEIESLATGEWQISCFNADTGVDELVSTGDLGQVERDRLTHLAACDECQHYGCYPQARRDVEESVNLNNGNARAVLAVLGLESEDLCGSAEPADFRARIVIARATGATAEAHRPTVDVTPVRGPRWVECGIDADYMEHVLGNLEALACEALRLGRALTWA